MSQAQDVYRDLCRFMDANDLSYARHDEDLTITTGISGDDFPIDIIMMVNDEKGLLSIYSILPYKITEERRIDLAVAVCAANSGMAFGCFDYDITKGRILYRASCCFTDCTFAQELYMYMLSMTASTVEAYNDRFFMVSKGMLSAEDFVKQENNIG